MVSLGCPHSRMTAIHEPAAGRKERITMKVAKINRNTPYGPRTSLRVAFVSLLLRAACPALGSAQLAQSVPTNPPSVYVTTAGRRYPHTLLPQTSVSGTAPSLLATRVA